MLTLVLPVLTISAKLVDTSSGLEAAFNLYTRKLLSPCSNTSCINTRAEGHIEQPQLATALKHPATNIQLQGLLFHDSTEMCILRSLTIIRSIIITS